MRNFIRTYVGKGLLYVAVILSTIMLALSVLGAAYMISSDYYLKSEEDILNENLESMTVRSAYEAFDRNFNHNKGKFDSQTAYDYGSFSFKILDSHRNVLTRSTTKLDSYPYRIYVCVLPPTQSGTDFYEITGISSDFSIYEDLHKNNYYTEYYIVEGGINPNSSILDVYRIYSTAHHILYSLKIGIYLIAVLALVLMIVSFVALMSVAGRRPKKEEIVPWYFHKMPFDILLAIYIFGSLALAALGGTIEDEVGIGCIAVCSLFLPLFCMSFAVRIKTKTLIRNTLIFKILMLLWKGIKAVGRFLMTVIKNMRLLWKVILVFVGLMFFWGITIAMHSWRFEAVLLFLAPFTVLPALIMITLQINRLKKGAQELSEGHFDHVIDTKMMLPEIKKHAVNLNSMAAAQKIAVEEKLKSERMKTELITNVSHDIKTPLTSIINYADLISKEENNSEKTKEYSEVLVRQSKRLKTLLEDLVEASKASTGNLEVDLQPCDAQVFISQCAGEYEEKFGQYDLTLITSVPEEPVRIMADGRRMQRVFDNLLNNACKYSMPGTRVYVDLKETDKEAVFTFKNTSKEQLNMTEDELMERFTRGDSSRNTEGSGLGLSIAGNLAELQNGKLRLTTDGDLFKATLSFPKI
ncbi:MAG: HAMP domain-containing histidine kinase [Clostridiales bacterium]|nr:HAMP domain-containing histidine kinase [Clostridiales bacterium]